MRTFWIWFNSIFIAWDLGWMAYDINVHEYCYALFQGAMAVLMFLFLLYWIVQD